MAKEQQWNHAGDIKGRFRGGKTASDHKSGAWGQRFANQAARAEWQQDNRATNATFPGGNR